MKENLTFIFGTRPEIIKLSPIIAHAKKQRRFGVRVIHTGQHDSLANETLAVFNIQPDVNLSVMTPNQTLSLVSQRILQKLEPHLDSQPKSDMIIVQGDTASVFLAALSAYHHQIPIAHIEAGLRTNNIYSPFPEEGYRQMTSRITNLHFCPTQVSVNNLIKEGIKQSSIHKVGNTVVDALLSIRSKNLPNPKIMENIPHGKKIILVTQHRRENFGKKHQNILLAIQDIARTHQKTTEIIFPVHPNPNIKKTVGHYLGKLRNVHLIGPVDYFTMVKIMEKSHLIITDSGGIQEEAPTFKVPVIVTRDTTERPEGVSAGLSFLVGSDKNLITHLSNKILLDDQYSKKFKKLKNPYGDGDSAKKIINIITNFFETKTN